MINGIVRFMQPFLISRAIDFVSRPQSKAEDPNTGYGLILAAVSIYSSIAVTNALYQQRHNRLAVMMRGGLVGLIHNKALTIQDGVFDDSAAVTLMSSDVEMTDGLFDYVTMFWSSVFEVIIGFYLLSRRLGWATVVPALLILGKWTSLILLFFTFDA